MKLVVITGASSGVGAASARRFARAGSKVVLVARRAEKLHALADEIGDQAVVMPCDAADGNAVAAMADKVLTLGVPDVVINGAGAGQWKTLQDTSAQEARTMMDAPYFSAFHVTKAFLPAMLEKKRGVFLHLNSPACMVNWPSSVGYAAARHALMGFHEAMAQDLRGTGVNSCHAIFGVISSDYWANNPGARDHMPNFARLTPELTPEQAAEVLVRLAHNPRHTAIYPLTLRIQLRLGSPFPGVMRWLARL